MAEYIKSKYVPLNPQKYEGDPTNIICRSSWERRFAKWCDVTPAIISWSSEETVVPYIDPVDQRWHRYFVDFKIKVKTKNGIKIYYIEIKPKKQTEKPSEPKRKTVKSNAKFLNEVRVYLKNKAKWEAADQFAQKMGCEFKILTEYDLGIKQ